jgi:hypothetical protein
MGKISAFAAAWARRVEVTRDTFPRMRSSRGSRQWERDSTISKRGAFLETGAENLPMQLQHERLAAFSNNSTFGRHTTRPGRVVPNLTCLTKLLP